MSTLSEYKPLRLLAADADDLQVISACLQDAVLKVGDFAYIPNERRFAFVANRFLWELADDTKGALFWRTRVGSHFDDVKAVKQLNIRADAKDGVLELLALRFEPMGDGTGVITFDFAGGGAIRLDVESINCEMRDISQPWRTRAKPAHESA